MKLLFIIGELINGNPTSRTKIGPDYCGVKWNSLTGLAEQN